MPSFTSALRPRWYIALLSMRCASIGWPAAIMRQIIWRIRAIEGAPAARKVSAGAERPARSGHDDRPCRIVSIGLIERVDQIVDHLRVERIELAGAIDRDGEDVFREIGEDCFVGHGGFLCG